MLTKLYPQPVKPILSFLNHIIYNFFLLTRGFRTKVPTLKNKLTVKLELVTYDRKLQELHEVLLHSLVEILF